MKDLLVKEFRLARHPTLFIFPFLGLMLMIPAYPYFVAFIYTCLSVFFIFLQGRENRDIPFTVSLPVNKRDVVKARCWFIAIIEVFEILVAVPFAIIGIKINPNPEGNPVGMEANVAFFGFVFILYALYNLIFLPIFYKTAYRAGIALLIASTAISLYIVAIEGSIRFIPALKSFLDTSAPAAQIAQLPILVAGIVIFAASTYLAFRMSASRFDKVDM